MATETEFAAALKSYLPKSNKIGQFKNIAELRLSNYFVGQITLIQLLFIGHKTFCFVQGEAKQLFNYFMKVNQKFSATLRLCHAKPGLSDFYKENGAACLYRMGW